MATEIRVGTLIACSDVRQSKIIKLDVVTRDTRFMWGLGGDARCKYEKTHADRAMERGPVGGPRRMIRPLTRALYEQAHRDGATGLGLALGHTLPDE